MRHPFPEDIRSALEDAMFEPGASSESIASVAESLGVAFPEDYVSFLSFSDGAEFVLGESSVLLYAVGTLEAWNAPEEGFPSHFKVFGGDGGSERFAFDVRKSPPEIVVVPQFEPNPGDELAQGPSLIGFLRRVLSDEAFG